MNYLNLEENNLKVIKLSEYEFLYLFDMETKFTKKMVTQMYLKTLN